MQQGQVQEIVNNFIEVKLKDQDSFLKVKETLTRMGVASKKANVLYQSCHILHKQDKYYVVHFKELFLLDGRRAEMTDEDVARRNTIVDLLQQWNLLDVVHPQKITQPKISLEKLKILPYSEKQKWDLQPKYKIGKFKQKSD